MSSNDVWAVGEHSRDQGATRQTLALHRDGTDWAVIPSANADETYNVLSGVAAVSPSEVWAVGLHAGHVNGYSYTFRTLIERWDGTSWEVVESPNVGAPPPPSEWDSHGGESGLGREVLQ